MEGVGSRGVGEWVGEKLFFGCGAFLAVAFIGLIVGVFVLLGVAAWLMLFVFRNIGGLL